MGKELLKKIVNYLLGTPSALDSSLVGSYILNGKIKCLRIEDITKHVFLGVNEELFDWFENINPVLLGSFGVEKFNTIRVFRGSSYKSFTFYNDSAHLGFDPIIQRGVSILLYFE